jgi:hypothetical protein
MKVPESYCTSAGQYLLLLEDFLICYYSKKKIVEEKSLADGSIKIKTFCRKCRYKNMRGKNTDKCKAKTIHVIQNCEVNNV